MIEFFIVFAAAFASSVVLGLKPLTLMQSRGYTLKAGKRQLIGSAAEVALITVSALTYALAPVNFRFIGLGLTVASVAATLCFEWIGARTKPVFTARFKRLFGVFVLITASLYLPAGVFYKETGKFLLFLMLSPYPAAAVALAVTAPFEKRRSAEYVAKAERFFARSVGLLKIGITGSAGKTSVKNMLAAALSKRYTVIVTEKNFNTPLGIARTVSKYRGEQIFIAEMGARRAGDIAELCKIVQPDIGIVTTVLPQHLETFGTIENVFAEKSELAKSAKLFAVLNGYDERVAKMETTAARIVVGDGGKVSVKNQINTVFGTEFTYADSEGEFEFSLPIAGLFTAQNAALAVTVARQLGVSFEEIQSGFSDMKQIPHRLEVTTNAAGVTIVDDAYNSNVEGAKAALELLSKTEGRKIVVAQGVVEMGKERRKANGEIGAALAGVADVAIFTGINAKFIADGYFANGGRGETYFAANLRKAQEIFSQKVRRGDIVFFQNDVPDNY